MISGKDAQSHNRFVFCVVVVKLAVNGNQALSSCHGHVVLCTKEKIRCTILFYGMFHVTWTTFKFNKNQLGTV